MNKLSRHIILPLLILGFVQCARAAQEPEFKLPCPQVLKLGLEKFADLYGEKTKDYSTYGMKQAFNYYVDCRRPDNDTRSQALSAAVRNQVNEVRDKLSDIGNASWSNAYIIAGGGTLYGLASVGAFAEREDFMGSLIATLLKSESSQQTRLPAARRRANLALNKARRALPAPRAPALESWTGESRAEMLTRYRSNVKEMRSAFERLQTIVRLLPDRPAELLARQIETEVSAGLEE
ncbi:MAG TPA: hypothetical protein DC047_00455 [Blastocatellia bacterium]|nr:hypothetical protein [Blastocatellia bacterium]